MLRHSGTGSEAEGRAGRREHFGEGRRTTLDFSLGFAEPDGLFRR